MYSRFGFTENKDDIEYNRYVINLYRSILLETPKGRELLAHMTAELGLLDQGAQTPEERALQDYAKRLLMLCGVFTEHSVEQVIDALSRVQPPVDLIKLNRVEGDDAGGI